MNRHIARACTIGFVAMGLSACYSSSNSTSLPDPDFTPEPNQVAANFGEIVTYEPTTADFPNPERGFHDTTDLMSGKDFTSVRKHGRSLVRSVIRLDEYRDRPLPNDFLTRLDQQLQLVRSSGSKIIPIFSYNHPTGEPENSPDATLDRVLSHINQLKPVLHKNADVVVTLQAGFIGAWGEWHSSKNKLDRPEPKAKILAALLAAMPPSRMVQVRYPNDIKTNYPQPLARKDAFGGKNQSRVAFHNDCFLASQTDAGTYPSEDPESIKSYLDKITPFVAVGGETCGVQLEKQRTDCETAEAELARFHWSYLNANFYKPALERWKDEGCYAAISKQLGYRLQLVKSSFPDRLKPGSQLQGNFVIKNVGYASPYNPRGLELILRDRQTGKQYRLPILKSLSKKHDPRFWFPKFGEISVNIETKIAKNTQRGEYDLFLNLPDPMPQLTNRPEYSIRLANERTWEPITGFNSLRRTIKVAN